MLNAFRIILDVTTFLDFVVVNAKFFVCQSLQAVTRFYNWKGGFNGIKHGKRYG